MKTVLLIILVVLLAPTLLFAQPIELSRGAEVTIIMGPGTSIPAGTTLEGKVVSEGPEGLRFYAMDRGLFYVKWRHILSVNGISPNEPQPQRTPPAPRTSPTPVAAEYKPTPAPAIPVEDRPSRYYDTIPSRPKRGYSTRDDDPSDQTNGHFFVSVDYFGTGNAANNPKICAQEFRASIIQQGSYSDPINATYNATGGWGVTAGYLAPIKEYLDIGASISYIAGPNYTYNLSPASGNHDFSISAAGSVSYLRLLALSRFNLPINRDWGMHLILGIGPALGWQKETLYIYCTDAAVCTALQVPAGVDAIQNYNFSSSAFAWQAGPSISYGKWELVLSASGLPRISGSENFNSIKMHSWTTFEANLRYSF